MESEVERETLEETETLEKKKIKQNSIELQRCKLLKPLKGLWQFED